MKIEMRRELASEPFEQKIRRVGQLIRLGAALRAQRMIERDAARSTPAKSAGKPRKAPDEPVVLTP